MARSEAVSPEDAYQALQAHPDWIVERDRIRRDFRCGSFGAAMELINRVASVAEAAGHHPNIRLHEWCFVELEIYSHVSGGLTRRDVDLATAIDAMIEETSR
ncbi:MAG TPA: 4a-hydroxytetrahydrobiopterin dehydratase [Candidatus Deferrimicrobium sp.]|nr:4a-hydroxytetrahydrobiopterin dehydratase [Candidatus Deferrimicrobium sp.]